MTRYAKKKDLTHNEIARSLAEAGYTVSDTAFAGQGMLDMIATSGGWLAVLVEAKSPGGKLTEAEKRFVASYRGPYVIAQSGACAVEQVDAIRARLLKGIL